MPPWPSCYSTRPAMETTGFEPHLRHSVFSLRFHSSSYSSSFHPPPPTRSRRRLHIHALHRHVPSSSFRPVAVGGGRSNTTSHYSPPPYPSPPHLELFRPSRPIFLQTPYILTWRIFAKSVGLCPWASFKRPYILLSYILEILQR